MRWWGTRRDGDGDTRRTQEAPRRANLFEAATDYVVACVGNDERAKEAAEAHVDPGAMMFGVSELARRAIVALAADRDTTPDAVARALLGLPART
jgi:hypothetical protein